MVNTEQVASMLATTSSTADDEQTPINLSKLKNHGIPLDHFDFKYVQRCGDLKELEKMYRVLEAGVEGKYPELEAQVYEKIKELAPNSRALRKDAPVVVKEAMPKRDRLAIDQEMDDFLKSMPTIETKLKSNKTIGGGDDGEPPIRSALQSLKINSNTNGHSSNENKPATASSGGKTTTTPKSVKPKDYREWAKIEQQLDDGDSAEEETNETKKEKKKEEKVVKVVADKTVINNNDGVATSSLIKNLPTKVKTSDLDEEMMTIKAEQEKCKGNEAFSAGSYQEALVYYTRSIQYLPTSASYNNRALTYIKLEEWSKAIDDCSRVLEHERDNFKALLRRATAYFKQKSYDEAKHDVDKCLSIDPKDKKAQELQAKLAVSIKENLDARQRVQKAGGKRLNIEETDGSDEENQQKKNQVNGGRHNSSKPTETSSENKVNNKRQIKIAEVEEDSEDEEEAEKTPSQVSQEKSKPSESVVVNSNKLEKMSNKPPPAFELPKDISDIKDRAIQLYSAGNYGEARDQFTAAIDKLFELTEKDHLAEVKSLLAILFSNRASCAQNIGNYKSCIHDCDLGLAEIDSLQDKGCHITHQTTRMKLMWKRACSLEAIEKYKEALKAYESLMRLDSTFKNVQLNYNRVKSILIQSGEFDKQHKKSPSTPTPVSEDSNKYEEYKQRGNEFVKLNDYEKACDMYSRCIEIEPTNPVAYLNRSLCHVKLNRAEAAIADASFVLERDENNVKALYRRAMAHRQKENWSQVVHDLKRLLAIEPQNQIAANELKQVQSLITTTTTTAKKSHQSTEKSSKKGQRVLIEECGHDDESVMAEKVAPIKETTSSSIVQEKKPVEQVTTQPETKNISTTEVIKKTFDKTKLTNGYEFLQAWNSINPRSSDSSDSYTSLIACIDPVNLPKFIGAKLDDQMLTRLIESIARIDQSSRRVDYLRELTKTQRFNVIKLFMASQLKALVESVIDSERPEDAVNIKKAYA